EGDGGGEASGACEVASRCKLGAVQLGQSVDEFSVPQMLWRRVLRSVVLAILTGISQAKIAREVDDPNSGVEYLHHHRRRRPVRHREKRYVHAGHSLSGSQLFKPKIRAAGAVEMHLAERLADVVCGGDPNEVHLGVVQQASEDFRAAVACPSDQRRLDLGHGAKTDKNIAVREVSWICWTSVES